MWNLVIVRTIELTGLPFCKTCQSNMEVVSKPETVNITFTKGVREQVVPYAFDKCILFYIDKRMDIHQYRHGLCKITIPFINIE